MEELLLKAETADTPNHWAKSAIRWLVALKNIAVGSLGGAWMAYAFLMDPEYALAFPVRTGMLIGAVLFPFIGFALLLRHWQRVLLWFPVAWMVVFTSLVVLSSNGVLTDDAGTSLEGYRSSVVLIAALEAANRKGIVAKSWDDLEAAGVLTRDFLQGDFFGGDSYSWQSEFDGNGRFTGTINIAGDRKRNIPYGTTTIGRRGRPVLELYGYNPHLLIVYRDW